MHMGCCQLMRLSRGRYCERNRDRNRDFGLTFAGSFSDIICSRFRGVCTNLILDFGAESSDVLHRLSWCDGAGMAIRINN